MAVIASLCSSQVTPPGETPTQMSQSQHAHRQQHVSASTLVDSLGHACDLKVSRLPARMDYTLRTKADMSKGPGNQRLRPGAVSLALDGGPGSPPGAGRASATVDSELDRSCPRGSCWCGCSLIPTTRSAQSQRPARLRAGASGMEKGFSL